MKILLAVLLVLLSAIALADERGPAKTQQPQPVLVHPVIGTTTNATTHHDSWIERHWWIGPAIGVVSFGTYILIEWSGHHAKAHAGFGAATGRTRYFENVGKPIDGFH